MDEGPLQPPRPQRRNIINRIWRWCRTPSATIGSGLLLLIGIGGGINLWGGFNTVLEATNSLAFCGKEFRALQEVPR